MKLGFKKENSSKEDFLLYLGDCDYHFDIEKSAKDTKNAEWYKKTFTVETGVELVIEVRMWAVIDIHATIVDWNKEIKTPIEGFSINLPKSGYTIQGYEVGLMFTIGFATQAYRAKSGNYEFAINSSDVEYKTI